ncbi:SCO3242 family prenyltransferase [Streptomyces liangshanensis]|uniref:UbiA family prenyltransferase n=1 Tax=Streptomyces liangshanensis TaxID=2717324 RepID=A0A6G9GTY1_9ACTN|nr:UbiA family prenyltransferase [Streptomyces liangshanensis]QIQ01723.1 UbiA family prenyltransferase [Streptomyces liangshanensis]
MRLRAWAELLRVSALFTVPGDALAGAAALGVRPRRGTALAVGASLCLYEAGMALNDWADREEDARDRPHRPIPSGRISPRAALAAAGALTAAGLALASRAGRPALVVSSALAATVWAYDLKLKHTVAGPVAMGAARALDLVLGAVATAPGTPGPSLRAALPSAAILGTHTAAVTTVSRREAEGGSAAAPLAALAATLGLAAVAARRTGRATQARPAIEDTSGRRPGRRDGPQSFTDAENTPRIVTAALATAYAATAAHPLLHAALNPSPPLTQRAVGGGIRAMIPLQGALAARGGAVGVGLGVMALVPIARALARKVSPT